MVVSDLYSSDHFAIIQVPTTDAPPPPLLVARHIEISSIDSGRPSSDSNGYDCSSSPVSYPSLSTQCPNRTREDAKILQPANLNRPIGYEPALCDPMPQFERKIAGASGMSLVHDALYRGHVQASSRRKNSIGHYQDPNSFRLMAYDNEPHAAPASVPVINNNSVLV
ncbi:unnamed protein product [Enterobius vermicularis]|uniref:Uncharacterized protein n=1 Tax=Enterobius vermicularis TaxID=51028 RepID=A0A3P6I4Y8_ENTVE|nr:unnamed protein product [Enterobius vermicularis]